MAVVLLQFIFWAIGSLANLLSFVVFRGAAVFFVALIQLFKVPRQAGGGVIEYVGDLVRWVLEYAVEAIKDVVASIVSSLFEALTSAAAGSVQLTTSAIGELLEKTKSGLDELSEVLPQVVEAASEMVVKIVDGVWSGCRDAVGYIVENA